MSWKSRSRLLPMVFDERKDAGEAGGGKGQSREIVGLASHRRRFSESRMPAGERFAYDSGSAEENLTDGGSRGWNGS